MQSPASKFIYIYLNFKCKGIYFTKYLPSKSNAILKQYVSFLFEKKGVIYTYIYGLNKFHSLYNEQRATTYIFSI